MNETNQDAPQLPPKRAQFPLWFLLFVIPTIAGLGFAISANSQKQASQYADLMAQRALLLEQVRTLEAEIELARQVDRQAQALADRWKSAEAVVDYFKSYHQNQKTSAQGQVGVPDWHDAYIFFLQADEADARRLLKMVREAYPTCDTANQYSLLDYVIGIPMHAPQHTEALTEEAQKLARLALESKDPQIRKQAQRLLQAFPSDTTANGSEGS